MGDSIMGLFYVNKVIEVVVFLEDKSYLFGLYNFWGWLYVVLGNYVSVESDYFISR